MSAEGTSILYGTSVEKSPQTVSVEMVNASIIQSLLPDRRLYKEISSDSGELGYAYQIFLNERVSTKEGLIGEIPIPEVLKNTDKTQEIDTLAINMGMGHRRPQRCYHFLLTTLGFTNVRDHFFGDKERLLNPLAEGMLRDALDRYTEQSIRDAKAKGMYDGPLYIAKKTMYTNALDVVLKQFLSSQGKEVSPSELMKIFAGDIDASTPKELEAGNKIIQEVLPIFFQGILFGKEAKNVDIAKNLLSIVLKKDIQLKNSREEKVSMLIFHPLFTHVLDKVRGVMPNLHAAAVVTDRVVEPAWVSGNDTEVKVLCAMKEARDATADFWKFDNDTRDTRMPVLNGFTMPMAGFMRNHLSTVRREALEKNPEAPITHILTASGIAPAQERSFISHIESIKDQLITNHAKMVIQCGYGEPGKLLFASLKEYISKNPEIASKICLHRAETVTGAVDFFEALAWTEQPVVLAVKASEMPNMAMDLGMPCIPLGCVGKVEDGNIRLMGKLPESSVIFTTRVVSMAKASLRKRLIEKYAKTQAEHYLKQYNVARRKRRYVYEKLFFSNVALYESNTPQFITDQIQEQMGHLDTIAIHEKDLTNTVRDRILHPRKNPTDQQAMLTGLMKTLGLAN